MGGMVTCRVGVCVGGVGWGGGGGGDWRRVWGDISRTTQEETEVTSLLCCSFFGFLIFSQVVIWIFLVPL